MHETTIIVKIHISTGRPRLSKINQYIHNLAALTRSHNRCSTKREIHSRSPRTRSSWAIRRFRAAWMCHLWPIHRFQVVRRRMTPITNSPMVSKWASNQTKICNIKWFQYEYQDTCQIIWELRKIRLPTTLSSSILKSQSNKNTWQIEIWPLRQAESNERTKVI